MCSIIGGTKFDNFALEIYKRAKDRGRDFSGLCEQRNGLWIGNHRATPTTELEKPNQNQPFGKAFKVVHNGTIQNDAELGVQDGDMDSFVLTKVLDPTTLHTLRDSLAQVKGSYAIAVMTDDDIYLACNYKPIWFLKVGEETYFSSLQHHIGPRAKRVPPYSVLSLKSGMMLELPRTQYNAGLVICSGGLDSTAVAAYAVKNHAQVCLLHFSYGCRAETPEIKAIKSIARKLGCEYKIATLPYVDMKGTSPLLNSEMDISQGVAGAEYAFEWVPARNFLFLAYATAYAEANHFGHIYLGTNLEEGGAYPDNEEQFIRDVDACLYGAVQNGLKVQIHSPLGSLMKREIVDFGLQYDAPFDLSWSCYEGGDVHCGECGPCYMRKTAFKRAGVPDPTRYKSDMIKSEKPSVKHNV